MLSVGAASKAAVNERQPPMRPVATSNLDTLSSSSDKPETIWSRPVARSRIKSEHTSASHRPGQALLQRSGHLRRLSPLMACFHLRRHYLSQTMAGDLAVNGLLWRLFNRIARRWNCGTIGSAPSPNHSSPCHYLIEFLGACFWVLYLLTVVLHVAPKDWTQWNGGSPAGISLLLLFFVLVAFGFADMLRLSYAGKPITLKRFHSWWTLSPTMIVAFVAVVQILGELDKQILFWTLVFSYSISLGFVLATMGMGESLPNAVKDTQWYKKLSTLGGTPMWARLPR